MQTDGESVREREPPPWELKPPPDFAPPCSVDGNGQIQFPIDVPKKEVKNICSQFIAREHGTFVKKSTGKVLQGLVETRGREVLLQQQRVKVGLGGIVAKLVELPFTVNRKNKKEKVLKGEQRKLQWFQLNLDHFGGIQMGVAGEHLLWACWRDPELVGNAEGNFRMQFYAYSSIDFHLNMVSTHPTMGNVIKTVVLEFSETMPYNFLIVLNDMNQIQAYDLLHRNMAHSLQLAVSPGCAFEDFQVHQEEQQILVLEKHVINEHICSIVIFAYPPYWSVVSVIRFNEMDRFELTLEHRYCLIFERVFYFSVATWADFFEKAIQVPVTSHAPNSSLIVEREYKMLELPSRNTLLLLEDPMVEFLNITPPMVYTLLDNGIDFYSVNNASDSPVYQLRGRDGQLGDDYTNVTPFPDKSSRILINNQRVNTYNVITFETNEGHVTAVSSQPFNDYTVLLPGDVSRRKVQIQRQKSVLAMAYCSQLKLFAVMFGDHNRFNVNIYKESVTSNFILVKTLPTVKRLTSQKYKVNSISNVNMSFKPDLLFAEITFENFAQNDTLSEVYSCPILMETFC